MISHALYEQRYYRDETKCAGALRRTHAVAYHDFIECDACGFQLTIRNENHPKHAAYDGPIPFQRNDDQRTAA